MTTASASTDQVTTTRPLIVACGALVQELRAVLRANKLGADDRGVGDHDGIEVRYLPANLHNRPDRIVPELEPILVEAAAAGRPVLVGYADCGTGGHLDALVDRFPNVRRLPGSHCYEFFTGAADFEALHAEELGSFFLTDFLAKHFEAIIWQGLGLDRHPQLRDLYFANYVRVVLLSQTESQAVIVAGQRAAEKLGLAFEHRHVGLAPFADAVAVSMLESTS